MLISLKHRLKIYELAALACPFTFSSSSWELEIVNELLKLVSGNLDTFKNMILRRPQFTLTRAINMCN